jgi:glycerol-3-phosphate dehydrogenase
MVAFLARTAAAHGAALATNVRMDGLLTGKDLAGGPASGGALGAGGGLTAGPVGGDRLAAGGGRVSSGGLAADGGRVSGGGLAAGGGRVSGVRARDLLDGTDLVIRGRHVVLAAGAWTNGGGGGDGGELRVRPSKGVHIVVPRDRIRMDTGLLTRTEKSVLFVIPWGDHWLIGDTDAEWPYDPGHPAASRADIDYLLAKVNRMLRDPLGADDIEGVFAGLRPLVAAGGDTTKLSREHTVDSSRPGLSVIAGGKYTTYRVMARDLIDAAARDLAGTIPPSRTSGVPLVGAAGYAERWQSRERLAAASGLPAGQVERLLGRYGACIDDLLELIDARPELGQPVDGSGGYLAAEIAYACTHEGAVRLDDVLARRTRIAIETRDRGLAAAALMAAELGWDDAHTSREVAQYGQAVAAELAAEREPDDQRAYQALLKAADPVAFYGAGAAPA